MDIFSTLIILSLLGYIAFIQWENNKERTMIINKFSSEKEELIKAVLARNLQDYTSSKIMERGADEPKKEEPRPPIPLEEADDEEFSAAIKEQLKPIVEETL